MYKNNFDVKCEENPLLESRGEHLFVHSGLQAYIKISKNFYNMLDREEEPCVEAGFYHATSYGEVSFKIYLHFSL